MGEIEHVLITGGCGFIGANLVRFLRDRTSWSLRVVDDLRAGSSEYVDEGLAEVRIGDVADHSVLDEALEGVDAVVHLASQTGVVPSVEDPVRDFEGNALTTFRVLEGCRRAGIRRVAFASSGAAVGEVPPPIHEGVVPRPLSPYGAGKLVGEAYCQGYAGSFDMDTVVLRFSNVYGPFSIHKNNAVPNFIKRCLKGGSLDIFGDGSQTRDFIHVEDLCGGILRSLTTDGIGGEVFQLGTGIETSILDLARFAQAATGTDADIQFHPQRAGEVYRSRVDIGKARRLLGFDPSLGLADGLGRTATWYREHWLDVPA
ncbi:MAG: NAD-dependent epimerase/dehydratase family protein [Actinomycetota bacterium]